MMSRMATGLTDWFIQQGLLQQEDYEVYAYCIDRLLSQILFYIILFVIAIYWRIVPQTIWYYIGFNAFRYTAGGYHARSPKVCVVLTWIVYVISMFGVYYISPFTMALSIAAIVCSMFASIVAYKYAPINHFNKPVSIARRRQMRKYCLMLQIAFFLLILVLLILHIRIYAFCLAFGNSLAALFLVYSYYAYQGERTV